MFEKAMICCRSARPLVLVIVAAHLANLGRAPAQSIGINSVGGAGEAGTLQPSDVAGAPGVAQAWWNNAPGTTTNLLDNSGRTTTMSVTWTSPCGVGTNGSLEAGPDFNLMRGSLRACPVGIGFHLNKIPYSVYDVVVYLSGSGYSGNQIFYTSPANFLQPAVAEGRSPELLYSNDFAGAYIEAATNRAGHFYRFSGFNFESVTIRTALFSLAGVQVVRSSEEATVPTLLSATLPGNLGNAKFWLLGAELRFAIQLFYPYGLNPKLALHGPAPAGADGPLILNLPAAVCINFESALCLPVTGAVSVTTAQATTLASDLAYLLVTPQPGSFPHNYTPVRARIVNNSNLTPALRMDPLPGALRFQWPTASREFLRIRALPLRSVAVSHQRGGRCGQCILGRG